VKRARARLRRPFAEFLFSFMSHAARLPRLSGHEADAMRDLVALMLGIGLAANGLIMLVVPAEWYAAVPGIIDTGLGATDTTAFEHRDGRIVAIYWCAIPTNCATCVFNFRSTRRQRRGPLRRNRLGVPIGSLNLERAPRA
jgi:hypothetical protein